MIVLRPKGTIHRVHERGRRETVELGKTPHTPWVRTIRHLDIYISNTTTTTTTTARSHSRRYKQAFSHDIREQRTTYAKQELHQGRPSRGRSEKLVQPAALGDGTVLCFSIEQEIVV